MNQARGKLLVIDPDPELAFSFSKIFRQPHFQVLAAHNLEQALSVLDRETPDLVLLEETFNNNYGASGVVRLRQRGYSQPVILMTSSNTPRVMSDALQAGAFDCVAKPFDLGRIREVVAHALGKERYVAPERKPAAGVARAVPANEATEHGVQQPLGNIEPGAIAGDAVFDLLFEEISRRQPLANSLDAFDVVERHLIRRALESCQGNQSRAAKFLGITRNTLRKRIQKYGFHGEVGTAAEGDDD